MTQTEGTEPVQDENQPMSTAETEATGEDQTTEANEG
jgi:hypothetical protein